jgi:hypothetical protein
MSLGGSARLVPAYTDQAHDRNTAIRYGFKIFLSAFYRQRALSNHKHKPLVTPVKPRLSCNQHPYIVAAAIEYQTS